MKGFSLKLGLIPEQFTVKAHPALFEEEDGEREGQKNWGTLSRGFGLRSFRPEISACGVFVGRRFRPVPKSPAENSAFSRDSVGPWKGGGGGGGGGERRTKLEWNLKKKFQIWLLWSIAGDRSKLCTWFAAFVSAAVLSAANKLRRLALCAFILHFDKIINVTCMPIYSNYLLTSILFLPISAKSRPVGTGSAYKPMRANFASDAYTLANKAAYGTTWWRLYRAWHYGRIVVYIHNNTILESGFCETGLCETGFCETGFCETGNGILAKRDSAKRDSAKRDSAKRDSAKRDSAKRDSAKREDTNVNIGCRLMGR